MLEIGVAHVRQILVKFIGALEEVQEKAAHQALVRADRRQAGHPAVIGVEVDIRIPRTLEHRLAVLAVDVIHRARQLEVIHEQHVVVLALAALEPQQVVQGVGLERVVRGGQALGELMHPVEVLSPFGEIKACIDIRTGRQLSKVSVNEVAVVNELGIELQQLIHLRYRQVAMNAMTTKSTAVFIAQVLNDQLR